MEGKERNGRKEGRRERNALKLRDKMGGRIRAEDYVFADNHRIITASLSIC